jgi:hypothetical protein
MKNEIVLYRPNELAEHIEARFDGNCRKICDSNIYQSQKSIDNLTIL